ALSGDTDCLPGAAAYAAWPLVLSSRAADALPDQAASGRLVWLDLAAAADHVAVVFAVGVPAVAVVAQARGPRTGRFCPAGVEVLLPVLLAATPSPVAPVARKPSPRPASAVPWPC